MKTKLLGEFYINGRRSGPAHLVFLMCTICIFFCPVLLAQSSSPVHVSYATFCMPDNQPYAEIYYSVDSRYLTFVKDSSGKLSTTAVIQLQITQSDSLVVDKAWKSVSSVDDTSRMLSFAAQTDVQRFTLTPGNYQLFLTVLDVPSKRQSSASVAIEQGICTPGKPSLSDVELCTSIVQSENQKSVFYKNTYEVMPLPTATFTPLLPVLYFYAEAYNLMALPSADYRVRTSIMDAGSPAGSRPVKTQEKIRHRAANSSVEIGTMNINNIPSGTYFLDLEILDSSRAAIASARKKFFVLHPSLAASSSHGGTTGDFIGSEFAVMSEEEVSREMEMASYIARQDEETSYKSLTLLNDKRKFLFEFWKKRNTNPSTPERHTRAAFRALAEDANREFRSMYKEGWKTDRGRVYLTYGKPDDVERYPNSAEYAPYEVWTYNNIDNLQSGVIFVFGDLYGTNIYRLVHSTHQAEVRNEYWMNELKKQ